ncbi:hypothetical protein COW46_02110 [Candidatus Gracilibacteria bacterium CG17_big_fil_post_rev_8_21_14_2_50_48_13]|nr:MAG: hypothetical protein COW46_02110 [Candidatus Gracilibacteria bacterium CG17_big_fil_post_rev_8_21_14_2_50_48_13]
MVTNTHKHVLRFLAVIGLAATMLAPASAQVSSTNTNTNGTGMVATGSAIVEATFDVVNMRTNTNAETTPAKPGDTLRVTATIRNVGNGDLNNFVPRVLSEELFKLGQIIDPGNGGVPRDSRAIEFPAINLAAGCNCEEKIAFSVQLVETMCQDFPQLVTGNMLINFQEKTRRVALSCSTPAPVQTNTPAPVKTTVTPVTTKAPVVPQTGPETFLTLTLALGAAGILTARRRRRRQDRA